MRGNKLEFNPIYSNDGVDSYRYLFILNSNDSTVSVFDTSALTVLATIVLTGSSSFNNINWVGKNKSVYVTANNHYNRIDADPTSGNFLSVVQSGSMTLNSGSFHAKYDPHFDRFLTTQSTHTIATDNSINLGVNSGFPFDPIIVNNSRIAFNIVEFAAATSPMVYAPKMGALLCLQNGNGTGFEGYFIRHRQNNISLITIGGLVGAKNVGVGNIIGNYLINGRVSSGSLGLFDVLTGQPIIAFTASLSDRASAKFVPLSQGGRIVAYQRINTNRNLSVFDWGSKSYLGFIDRTAYSAANENCTRQLLFCPYDKHFYVLGANTLQTGVVNLLHRYNPANSLGSMYQASYTIGNSSSAPVYSESLMCMNGFEPYEFEDNVY